MHVHIKTTSKNSAGRHFRCEWS